MSNTGWIWVISFISIILILGVGVLAFTGVISLIQQGLLILLILGVQISLQWGLLNNETIL